MLTMAKKDDIREAFYRKGMSKAEIARALGVDRKTVKKYIDQDRWNGTPPERRRKVGKLDPWKPVIDAWLDEDLKHREKQRHTAKRVFERLGSDYEGFSCGYRTVAYYVAGRRRSLYQRREGYLSLNHMPGEAQYDFGKAEFIENGKVYHGSYLTISFPHSNAGFTQLFKGETFECFAQGAADIFEYLGGVPPAGWFDNASTLVVRILKGGNRALTDSFLRFKNHYRFDSSFCNPASGHEKGSVEAKVGYHRRNLLVPVPECERLEDFNKELLKRCEQDMVRSHYKKDRSIASLFEEDKATFLPLPSVSFEAVTFRVLKADGYGKVLVDGKHSYSSRPEMAGKSVTMGFRAHRVEIYDESMRIVVSHPRLYGPERQEAMEWLPYLKQLSRRPGALKYTGIYRLLPGSVAAWLEGSERGDVGKALKLLAQLTEETSFSQAADAFEKAVSCGLHDLDSIRMLHTRKTAHFPTIERIRLSETVPRLKDLSPDVGAYDRMLHPGCLS